MRKTLVHLYIFQYKAALIRARRHLDNIKFRHNKAKWANKGRSYLKNSRFFTYLKLY